MNRNRWIPVAAVLAVLAVVAVLSVVAGVSLLWRDGPPPPSSGQRTVPTGREPFAFDAAYADADPLVLIVRYGDSGSCPSLAVRHNVVQEPDRIVVTLSRTPLPTDQACTSDYRVKLVRVPLTSSLGSREVVDGLRKEPVPISTGSPPFG